MNCLRKCMVCTPKALGLEDEYELCDYLQDFLPVRQWSPLNATEQIEGLGDPRKSKKKSEHSVLTWSSLAIECQCLWKLCNSSLCVLAEFTLALLVTKASETPKDVILRFSRLCRNAMTTRTACFRRVPQNGLNYQGQKAMSGKQRSTIRGVAFPPSDFIENQ